MFADEIMYLVTSFLSKRSKAGRRVLGSRPCRVSICDFAEVGILPDTLPSRDGKDESRDVMKARGECIEALSAGSISILTRSQGYPHISCCDGC